MPTTALLNYFPHSKHNSRSNTTASIDLFVPTAPTRMSRSNDPMTVTYPQQTHDDSLFTEKVRKFNQADNAFRTLLETLTQYKDAMHQLAKIGLTVADSLHAFFPNADSQHRDVADKFVQAQNLILQKLTEDALTSFNADVLAPIKSRIDEIPDVRAIMKQRQDALLDMHKRQKKLHSERKKDGPRLRDKQRKFKDSTDRYAMFHDDLVKRFNYIERNMANFVSAPFRSLVTILAALSKSSLNALSDVVQRMAETPPMTKDISPTAPVSLHDAGGVVQERWDNDFDDDINLDDDDEERDDNDDVTEDFETDSKSARCGSSTTRASAGKSGRPPHGRIKSADCVPRSPDPMSNIDSAFNDLSMCCSPRRGRSASSAPAETLTSFIPNSSSTPREGLPINGGAGSSSGRGSLVGDQINYTIVANSGASVSSASTENITSDRLVSNTQSYFGSYQRRRLRDGKASTDTTESSESLGRNDVLLRVVAMYDFSPQEANELEVHEGDVIEVTAKHDGGWWCGQIGRSLGYFPRNYTRELTTKEELDFLEERERRRRRAGRRADVLSQESRRSGPSSSNGILPSL